jgi:hypothetical protein
MTVPGIFIAVKSNDWVNQEARLREQGGRGGVNLSPDGDGRKRRLSSH